MDAGKWRRRARTKASTRRYRDSTLILETEFETAEGAITLIDFMPLRGKHSHIVRLVRGKRGKVNMTMELTIRFDYGRTIPWVTRLEDGTMRAIAGPDMLVLRTPAPVRGENLKTVSEFTVGEGETVPFVLSYGASHRPDSSRPLMPSGRSKQTETYWRKWADRCTYRGPRAEAVCRSLITLKALTYLPTGGIVAAPTTSLPEKPHGVNATGTIASAGCGMRRSPCWPWCTPATTTRQKHGGTGFCAPSPEAPHKVQIMYGVAGERHLAEWEVPWLAGYQGASPVRIGNAASGQLQLDIYGELADALHQAREGRLPKNEPAVELQRTLLEHLEQIWQEPDEGIWEVRGPKRQFTHSKVMAWVAFDRTIKSAEKFGLKAPLAHWRSVRKRIHEDVCQHGFDPDLGSFVQSYGSKNLDASLLLLPLVGFLPLSDSRMRGTVEAIERNLMSGGLVKRYSSDDAADGLPPGEGAFLACSFWLADNYVLLGEKAKAEKLFDKLLGLRNDLGLLAEEYSLQKQMLPGQFPAGVFSCGPGQHGFKHQPARRARGPAIEAGWFRRSQQSMTVLTGRT